MPNLAPRLARGFCYLVAAGSFAACGYAIHQWTPEVWAQARMAEANAKVEDQFNNEARAILRTLLRRLPEDRAARRRLIELELRDGRYEQAYLELKAHTELFPDDWQAWLHVAQLMHSGGLLDEAEAAAANAVAAAPEEVEPRALRATIRLRRERWFAASVDARAVLARARANIAMWGTLAQSTAALAGPAAGVAVVRQGLEANPGNAQLNVALGRALAQAGQVREAREVLSGPAQADRGARITALSLLARLEMREGRAKEATEALDQLLVAQPAYVDAVSARALIDAVAGRHTEALARLDAMTPYEPSLLGARQFIAASRSDPARLRAALEQWSKDLLTAPKAAAPIAAQLRHGEKRERGEIVEGHAMVWPGTLAELRRDSDRAISAQNWTAAAEVALRARRLYPGSVIGPWIDGVSAMAQSDFAGAAHFFSDALEAAPRSALIVKGLAQTWVRQGNAADAADKLMKLVHDDPGFSFARRHAANHYLNARRPDLAEAVLRAGIDTPGDPGSYADLSAFYADVDRDAEALRIAEEGLAKYPKDLDLMSLAAGLIAGTEPARAIPRYEALLQQAPDRDRDALALAHLQLATAEGRAHALELLKNVSFDAPGEVADAASLGWALNRAGEPAKALPWLEAASQAAPEDFDIRFHLAEAYVAAGRKKDAIAHLDFALASGQPFASEPEARKLRQSLN